LIAVRWQDGGEIARLTLEARNFESRLPRFPITSVGKKAWFVTSPPPVIHAESVFEGIACWDLGSGDFREQKIFSLYWIRECVRKMRLWEGSRVCLSFFMRIGDLKNPRVAT